MFKKWIVALGLGAGALGGCDQLAQNQMDEIHNKVAADAEEQYRMVDASGSAIDKCVHAGLVAAAYLQAKEDANYQRWKSMETTNCAAAGVPR